MVGDRLTHKIQKKLAPGREGFFKNQLKPCLCSGIVAARVYLCYILSKKRVEFERSGGGDSFDRPTPTRRDRGVLVLAAIIGPIVGLFKNGVVGSARKAGATYTYL